MSSWRVWLVVVAGVATLGGLRWVLADFLLDQFGSRRTGWLPYEDRRPSERESAEPRLTGAPRGGDDRRR